MAGCGVLSDVGWDFSVGQMVPFTIATGIIVVIQIVIIINNSNIL